MRTEFWCPGCYDHEALKPVRGHVVRAHAFDPEPTLHHDLPIAPGSWPSQPAKARETTRVVGYNIEGSHESEPSVRLRSHGSVSIVGSVCTVPFFIA